MKLYTLALLLIGTAAMGQQAMKTDVPLDHFPRPQKAETLLDVGYRTPLAAKCQRLHWPQTPECEGVALGMVRVIGVHWTAAPREETKQEKSPANVWPTIVGVSLVNKDGTQGSTIVEQAFTPAVEVDTKDGRVVKLSDAEYAELQKLRAAVTAKEDEVAKAHGVDLGQRMCDMGCFWVRPPERHEFRGQFLLIDVPDAGQQGRAR